MKTVFGLLFSLLVTYWAVKPLFLPGFFPVHDNTQPSRIFEMSRGLREGQFPVRWVADLGYGYGYPLFNFYAPLPYYVGSFFNLSGLDVIGSTKAMYFTGIILAAIFMFLLGRKVGGVYAGLAASVLFTYAPYHAVDIYVRGSVGEYYAMAFFPLLLLGICQILKREYKKGVIASSLGLSGILLSHNIYGMLTLYLLFLAMILFITSYIMTKKSLPLILCFGFFIILSLGLSAFFILPAFTEKQYTKVSALTGGGSDFRFHFVYPDQLWNSNWGFGGSAPGREDGMSFKIGKIHLIFGLSALFYAIYLRRKKQLDKERLYFMLSLSFVFVLCLVLMLEPSRPLWDIIPGFAFIQYPWRFLGGVIFILSFLTSYLFLKHNRKTGAVLLLLIIVPVITMNAKYFNPRETVYMSGDEYTDYQSLRKNISAISDEYMPPDFILSEVARSVFPPQIGVQNTMIKETAVKKEYMITTQTDKEIVANIAYFPGWSTYIDGIQSGVFNSRGRIAVRLPEGEHRVVILLEDTSIRKTANTISLFSLFLLLYVSFDKKGFLWRLVRKSRS